MDREKIAEPQSVEKSIEVSELQQFSVGPFEAGVSVEFVKATYGSEDNFNDVTEFLRRLWDHENGIQKGLQISAHSYNHVFQIDPAPMKVKKLKVVYRLHNVRQWDVSRGNYAEGLGKVPMALSLITKAMTNVVGVTLAGAGYATAKAETGVRNTWAHFSGQEPREVADSEVFQWGFNAWMTANGIIPSITYDETGAAGIRVMRLYSPDDDPLIPAPASDMKQTPILVANHICYIDGPILAATLGAPKVLAKAGTLSMPLLGSFADEIGVIEVDRDNKDSRSAAQQAINEHIRDWRPGIRPLLLFPEGTTSNGDDLLPFKAGAFKSGSPVRPVVLCYTGDWHPANVNFKTVNGEIEPTSDAEWYTQFLGHMVHSLQIKVLAPYVPNEVERSDPEIFMNNVRELMRKAYAQLKTECENKQKQGDEDSMTEKMTDLARKLTDPLIGAMSYPVDMTASMLGRVTSFGESDWDSAATNADKSSRLRSQSEPHRKSKKSAKHEVQSNDLGSKHG
jgi:1-acyl-sn-glycerol-3-phosphate acyltransferase